MVAVWRVVSVGVLLYGFCAFAEGALMFWWKVLVALVIVFGIASFIITVYAVFRVALTWPLLLALVVSAGLLCWLVWLAADAIVETGSFFRRR